MINTMFYEGRIIADPELRFTPNGFGILEFRVAQSDSVKNEDGSFTNKRSLFLDIKVLGEKAPRLAQTLAKSDVIVAKGKLTTEQWETKDGQKRSKIVVLAYDVFKDATAGVDAPGANTSQQGAWTSTPQQQSQGGWNNTPPQQQAFGAVQDDQPPF